MTATIRADGVRQAISEKRSALDILHAQGTLMPNDPEAGSHGCFRSLWSSFAMVHGAARIGGSGNREEGGRREVADMVPLYLGLLDQSGPDLGREDLIMGSEHARNLEAALIKL